MNNTCKNNSEISIHLFDSSNNNTILNNSCSGNLYGVYLQSSSNNNTVTENTAKLNTWGIYVSDHSSNNSIYFNNFIDNSENICSHLANIWNLTAPIEYTYNGNTYTDYFGNYWDDYTGNDTNSNGIGDSPTIFTIPLTRTTTR